MCDLLQNILIMHRAFNNCDWKSDLKKFLTVGVADLSSSTAYAGKTAYWFTFNHGLAETWWTTLSAHRLWFLKQEVTVHYYLTLRGCSTLFRLYLLLNTNQVSYIQTTVNAFLLKKMEIKNIIFELFKRSNLISENKNYFI